MKLRKLIHPVLALTLGAMLYTGCNRKDYYYILMPPHAICISNSAPIVDGDTSSYKEMHIAVTIPGRQVDLASRFSLPSNAAYALSVKESEHRLLEKIKDIRVRPISGYNSKYAALEDISASCIFASFSQSTEMLTKDSMLTYLDAFNLGTTEMTFVIRLNEPPSDVTKQQFIVELVTEGESILTDTTQNMTLTF